MILFHKQTRHSSTRRDTRTRLITKIISVFLKNGQQLAIPLLLWSSACLHVQLPVIQNYYSVFFVKLTNGDVFFQRKKNTRVCTYMHGFWYIYLSCSLWYRTCMIFLIFFIITTVHTFLLGHIVYTNIMCIQI